MPTMLSKSDIWGPEPVVDANQDKPETNQTNQTDWTKARGQCTPCLEADAFGRRRRHARHLLEPPTPRVSSACNLPRVRPAVTLTLRKSARAEPQAQMKRWNDLVSTKFQAPNSLQKDHTKIKIQSQNQK